MGVSYRPGGIWVLFGTFQDAPTFHTRGRKERLKRACGEFHALFGEIGLRPELGKNTGRSLGERDQVFSPPRRGGRGGVAD